MFEPLTAQPLSISQSPQGFRLFVEPMSTYASNKTIPVTCFISGLIVSVFLASAHMASAQSYDEMRVLQMYYKKEDLVVSATRHPKPVSQAAENISIIPAEEIESMNAHTVAEVLNRIPGLFVSSSQEFGATSLLHIQGSDEWHVLVLLDGFPWNFLSGGLAQTNSIPIGIVERIEVIKGPASSAWGSSLGGVVNIITKKTANTRIPEASIRASWGEKRSRDHRGQLSGKVGSLGYYLYGGRQESDGLRPFRHFDGYSFYAKVEFPVSSNVVVDFRIGYSDLDQGLGEFQGQDIRSTWSSRNFFARTSLSASLTRQLSLDLSLYMFKQKAVQGSNALGLGFAGTPGELFLDVRFDEQTLGARGKLVWEQGMHTVVAGVDFDHGRLDQGLDAGRLLQAFEVPATTRSHPEIGRWAVYANDTIVIRGWSITPGLRYDYDSITGPFVSPSLGVTYCPAGDTTLRASVARGFTTPPLSWSSGGGLFLDPNPALEPEEVWSYQAGVESAAAKYFWAKATIFLHDLENALVQEPFGGGKEPISNDLFINKGKIRRWGFEIEAETVPVYNLSLLTGLAYVNKNPSFEPDSTEWYTCNIGIRYDDKKSFKAELFGRYIWWNLKAFFDAKYDDFIWDLNASKKFVITARVETDVFLTVHNLFNSSQYAVGDTKNPRRWVEGGIRVRFD